MNSVEIDLKNPVLARDSPLPLYPHVKLLGVPIRKGQPKDGTQLGPKLIRDTDIFQYLQSIGKSRTRSTFTVFSCMRCFESLTSVIYKLDRLFSFCMNIVSVTKRL
ncbi:hypothetical protein AHF37_07925 [Paragonimus kellicotti]|nr:hypothetical protein AHF37_07925 [Paragonimus kellicotti]